MPKANTVVPLQFAVTEADGETQVPGLVLADINFRAWLNGGDVALIMSDFVDMSDGYYHDGYYEAGALMPNLVGAAIRIEPYCPADQTRVFDPDVWEGILTANNIDDVAVLAARPPSVTLAGNVSPKSAFTITVYKGDGRTIRIPIYDDDGNLVNLTLWENFRFSIQNSDQTVVSGDLPYNQTTGITGGADGFLTVELPEGCSAYDVHLAGHKKTTLYHSCDANLIADTSAKTRTLRAGPFVILSKETPSP